MGTDPLTLVVLYSNMSTQKFKVQNRRHAEFIIHDEGDHVMDWYIEEDMKNERLRKEGG